MSFQTLAGVFLISGSLSFLAGALLPTWRVYMASDLEERLEWIVRLRPYWIISHILFLSGSLETAFGLTLLAFGVPGQATLLAIGGAFCAVAAVLAFSVIVYLRLSLPPEEYVCTTQGQWTFPAYSAFTLAAFSLTGLALLRSGYPLWLGGGAVLLSALLLGVYLLRRDLPPVFFYFISLGIGLVLVF